MSARVAAAIALWVFVVFAPAPGLAATSILRGIAIDRSFDLDPSAVDLPPGAPAILRLTLDRRSLAGPNLDPVLVRLDQLLDAYQRRSVPVVLALGSFPVDDAEVEPWRQAIRAVAERARGRLAAYQIGEVQSGATPDVARYVYLLKLAAVQIRSIDADAQIVQGLVPATEHGWQAQVFAAGTASYVDGVAASLPAVDDRFARTAVEQLTALVEREKPSATLFLGPISLPPDAAAATARLIDTVLRSIGTKIQVTAFAADPSTTRNVLIAAVAVRDLVGGDLVTLDEKTAGLRLTQAGADVTTSLEHRLVYNLTTFDTFLVYWGGAGGPAIDVEVTVANGMTPMVRDPTGGTSTAPSDVYRGPGENRLRIAVPSTGRPMIVDFNFGAAASFGTAVDVQTERLPRVEEIIFRHQQVQAAQDAALQNYIAHVRIEQHFHPSPADPAYNVITENRLFSGGGGVEWEEQSFELNGAKWTSNRPPFPLLQPEKVLSLPLDLRLNQDYTYRLDGVETVEGRPAFVVRFDPVNAKRALYRGTVWIDRRTFVRLKIQAVETRLSGPVVSNDETQIFESAGELSGRPVWLLSRLASKQIFLIAGRNVLVERELRLSGFALNSPEFESERSRSRAGNGIMYRDTDAGVRYLVKQGETRVVSDRLTTSATAFALGADVDPSFDYPLPIGGLNILDFNFLNKDLQLALLFGGVIALGNVQHANLWGGKFDVSVDFFGLALKSNDDMFDSQGKLPGERVNKIPVSTGFNLGYQVTPFQKVSGHYELHYDSYFRDAETAANFVIPSSTATNGEGVGYEYRRQGYSVTANLAAYQRATWTPWGVNGSEFDPDDRTYSKYDVGLSKDFIFDTFHTIHLNGTYFGGQRLDRFSMYQFGLFDATRMHGVPSAVRFGELGMFRASYSFNVFEQYRLDLFLDQASGRDPQGDGIWRSVTGTGIRVNLKAPHDTILQVDFGKSFLPEIYRGAGSTVLQVLLLKPL